MIENKWLRGRMIGIINPKIKYFIIFILFFLLLSLPITFALEVHLTYDENGNLITGDGKFREYDEFNQLTRVRAGFNNVSRILEEYVYHPTEDRILEKKAYDFDQNLVETIIYVNDNLVRKINSTGTFDTVYVKDEQGIVAELQPNGKKIYYHNDHLGSTTLITNQSGNVVENTSYAPFGEILQGGNTSRFDYEGKEFSSGSGGYGEGTQDYDYNFRKYDPGLKIFTKPESLFPNVYDPQQLNRYAFEKNNPYKYVDPSGNVPIDIVLDIGFVGYDIYTLATQGVGENNENLKALGLDIVGAVIPYATGLGAAIRVGKTTDKAIDAAKLVDKAGDATGTAKLTSKEIGDIGESKLLKEFGGESQVTFKTDSGGRRFDQFSSEKGIAREAKTGYQSLTKHNRQQIDKTAELLNKGTIRGSSISFYKSPVTSRGGGSKNLLNYAGSKGISVFNKFKSSVSKIKSKSRRR